MVKNRNYSRSTIYKLINCETGDITIGVPQVHSIKFSHILKKKLGVELEIELIQDFPCNSFEELKKRKVYYSGEDEPVKKKRVYTEANKEKVRQYCEANKETRSEKAKLYYQQNKDVILAKVKVYRDNNRHIINEQKQKRAKEIPEVFKARAARYREKNQEAINERARAYYAAHRDEMREQQRKRYKKKATLVKPEDQRTPV